MKQIPFNLHNYHTRQLWNNDIGIPTVQTFYFQRQKRNLFCEYAVSALSTTYTDINKLFIITAIIFDLKRTTWTHDINRRCLFVRKAQSIQDLESSPG